MGDRKAWQFQDVILADQMRSLDWRRRSAEHIGTLPEERVAVGLQKLKTLLEEIVRRPLFISDKLPL